jgi:thiopurine S-methyltransferase
MDIAFWAARWEKGRIGFHEGHPNTFLEKHVDRLGRRRRVLVPLCGKTEDMAFLASKGHEVIGIEAVDDAVRAFFEEHRLTPEVKAGSHVRSYAAGGITILSGDFFAVTKEDVGRVDALYDRAALVALPDAMRPKYVRRLRALLAPDALALLITFEFSKTVAEPPFSVGEDEVRTLYEGARIDLIDAAPAHAPRLSASGVTAIDHCFAIAT